MDYAVDGETLSIKNADNEIVTFSSDKKGGGGVSGDYVAKSGDTMTGALTIETTINIGSGNTASGAYSFTQGSGCTANGINSHAEGSYTIANALGSHAEGSYTIANALGSHAEGQDTTAAGNYSHAEGFYTIANNRGEHASGAHNASISGTNQDFSALTVDSSATLFSIGNGTSAIARKNAFEVKWNGDTYFSGDTKFAKGITSPTIDDINTKILALETKLDNLINTVSILSEKIDSIITP